MASYNGESHVSVIVLLTNISCLDLTLSFLANRHLRIHKWFQDTFPEAEHTINTDSAIPAVTARYFSVSSPDFHIVKCFFLTTKSPLSSYSIAYMKHYLMMQTLYYSRWISITTIQLLNLCAQRRQCTERSYRSQISQLSST